MTLNTGNPLSPHRCFKLFYCCRGGWEKRQPPAQSRFCAPLAAAGWIQHLLPLTAPPAWLGSGTNPAPLSFSLLRGDLEVIYPQLGDVGCSYIPQCHQYRWRISREWGSPRVRYPRADKVSAGLGVLVLLSGLAFSSPNLFPKLEETLSFFPMLPHCFRVWGWG